jgi:hypothetical protein
VQLPKVVASITGRAQPDNSGCSGCSGGSGDDGVIRTVPSYIRLCTGANVSRVGTTVAVACPPYMPETSILMDYRR